MRVGVWLGRGYTPGYGGGYAYIDRLVRAVDKHEFPSPLEIVFLTHEGLYSTSAWKKEVLRLPEYRPKLFSRMLNKSLYSLKCPPRLLKKIEQQARRKRQRTLHAVLRSDRVKLVYYPFHMHSPIDDYPFITTCWDIGHLSTYAFPELTGNGNYEQRDRWFRSGIPKAQMVFVESEHGKMEVLRYLTLNPNKVKVVPLFSGSSVVADLNSDEEAMTLSELGLKRHQYFFYPAQFWAHKNHYNLILAFKEFVRDHPNYKLALTGSDQGNLRYVTKLVENLGLSKNIAFLGFVANRAINILYHNATALVFPSYLGPTNMPLLEARDLNCPVLCSDTPGHKELMGDGALYFAPSEPGSILAKVMEILIEGTRTQLLSKAKLEREVSTFNINGAISAIETHLLDYANIRNCWDVE